MEAPLPCPRCQAPLDERDILEVEIDACNSCHGILVQQKNLVPLLDALSKASATKIDPDIVPAAVHDDHPVVPCPDCSKPMTRFGYMEARVVTLDRCSHCWQVWIDDGKLPTVVHMHARITGQVATQRKELDELSTHLSRLVFVGNFMS